jgi:hypothetical protein
MVPVANKLVNQSGGIDTSVGFSIKSENLGVVFAILRSQLYSDPIMAVIREYSTNAVDAQVMAGKPDEPILVSLPNQLDCFLKVRDFGAGLSDEEVQDIYASYGESTKRKSQDATGMLGIGCKSGFAYNDSFIVNSYKDGVMTAWNAFIDPSNRGQMAKMGSCESTEPSGIEIVIPVKHQDIDKFRSKAFHLFSFFKVKPKLANLSELQQKDFEVVCSRNPIYKGDNWAYMGNRQQSCAVMGNIPYPIDYGVFGNDLKADLVELVRCGIILNFKIGELEFAASREALQYTPFTKKAIVTALENIKKSISESIEKDFANCKTLWEAKCLYHDMFHSSGKLYHVRYLIKNSLTFNGKPVDDAPFSTNGKTFLINNSIYYKGGTWASDKVRREVAQFIEPRLTTLVVLNDKKIVNGILNRVVEPIETKKCSKIYVLSFSKDEEFDVWKKESSYDGPIVNLSSLPKKPLSDFYSDLRGSGTMTGLANPKYSTVEFEYDKNPANNHHSKSDYWVKANVDVSKDEGIYLEIDRFEYKDSNGLHANPRNLTTILGWLDTAGVVVPKIYGFKLSSVVKARANPKMKTFWVWVKEECERFFKANPQVQQDLVDRKDIAHQVSDCRMRIKDLLDVVRTKPSGFSYWIHANHPLDLWIINTAKKFFTTNSPKLGAVELLINHGFWVLNTQIKNKINIRTEFDAFFKKYPLFFRTFNSNYYDIIYSSDLRDEVATYVKLIDAATLTGTPAPLQGGSAPTP